MNTEVYLSRNFTFFCLNRHYKKSVVCSSLTVCSPGKFDMRRRILSYPRQSKTITAPFNNTTPGELKNRGFTLKTQQTFSFHTTPEEFEKRNKIADDSGLVFEENSGRGITIIVKSSFSKFSFVKMLSVNTKTKSSVFVAD